MPSVVPRGGHNEPAPAAALGAGFDGQSVLVVCSVGIDLDLPPSASDLAQLHQPDRVHLVVPARDHHPLLVALTERLLAPADLLAVEGDWTGTASLEG